MNFHHDNVCYLDWVMFPDTIVFLGLVLAGVGFVYFCWRCEND